ncbi:MAG: hypothetical protein QOE68_3250 [Thermoanaerobaculia bacterium]|nr:hypothetical protein [Thermoanaerobaculia bacterium]
MLFFMVALTKGFGFEGSRLSWSDMASDFPTPAQPEPRKSRPSPPIGLSPGAMVWTDGPSTLPPGSKMAVLAPALIRGY